MSPLDTPAASDAAGRPTGRPTDRPPDRPTDRLTDPWAEWETPPLDAEPAALPNAESIPPREWLYGTRLIRRFVSVLVSPGGVGKSALAMGMAVALASGRGILGERVHHSVPAWVLNLEDPLDELNRRLAALLMQHGVAPEEIRDRLFLHSGRARRLCMARVGSDGVVEHPDQAAIVNAAKSRGIGLIVVDPFVKSHGLDENSNAHMDAAATAWAEVADITGAAVLLVHHVRKGSAGPGQAARPDVEAARGGKALTDAARAAFILAAMTAEEAEATGISPRERWRHIRLDDAKANMAPRADDARWFRLESVSLGNATADYPHGDHVAAIAPWSPKTAWSALSPADCNRALDVIAAGAGDGVLFSARRGGMGAERWAGHALTEPFGLTPTQAAEVIGAWLRNGLLREVSYRDPAQRKTRTGLAVVDSRRPPMERGAASRRDVA
jgi:hypothetical protein